MIDEEALLKRTEDQTVYIALSKPNALTTRSLEALVGISWRSTATGKCDRLVAPERASEESKLANWGPWSKVGCSPGS